MIKFGEPICKDEFSFGYVWYIPISNTKPKGLKAIIQTRDILTCHIHGSYIVNNVLIAEYDWTESSVGPIALPANSEPYNLDLVAKKQGYDWCSITTVTMDKSQYLPANSSTIVHICVIEGDDILGCSDYRIENYGSNINDLRVIRLSNKTTS